MAFVNIPYESFIGFWHGTKDADDCLYWLLKNIGASRQNWKASPSKDDEYAIFWFRHDEDAMAFKLRWT